MPGFGGNALSCDAGLLVLLWMPGSALLAHRGPKNKTFEAWKAVNHSDAPQVPTGAESGTTIARVMKHIQAEVRAPQPATLRGRWTGTLICGDRPVLELKRSFSQYGTLTMRSGPSGWTGTFERREGWFTKATVDTASGANFESVFSDLFAKMMGLVKEACAAKDTRRRTAFDQEYAAKHPQREAKAQKDPVGKLIERWSTDEPEAPAAKKTPAKAPAAKAPAAKAPVAKAPAAKTPAAKAPAAKAPAKPTPAKAPEKPAAKAPAKAPAEKKPRSRPAASPETRQYALVFKGALKELASELNAELGQ